MGIASSSSITSRDERPRMAAGGELQPLHVLTLTPFFPSAEDPVNGCFVAEAIAHLKQQNVESSVIAVRPLHYSARNPNPGSPAEWVRFPQVPGNLGLSTAGKFLYTRLLGRVQRLHENRRIDLIHAHAALPCGHAAALLARRLQLPFVVTLHGLDVFNSCFESGTAAIWRRAASCAVYRSASAIICISGQVAARVEAEMGSTARTVAIHNGVDEEMFFPVPGGEPDRPVILMVGNLLKGKGQELVLRAAHRLLPSMGSIEVHLIGEGADRPRFEALAAELGLGKHVCFLGRKSRAEVAEAMRACSVFALPSRFEGLGCVYLEAMASGKPVIACAGQGMDDVIEQGKNGWLIPADGLDELTSGLDLLLRSPALREQVGAAARQTILDRFTLSHQAERLAAVYAAAIS